VRSSPAIASMTCLTGRGPAEEGDEGEHHCHRHCHEDSARVTSGARPARAEAEDEENSS
jgi:hypothetical protein